MISHLYLSDGGAPVATMEVIDIDAMSSDDDGMS